MPESTWDDPRITAYVLDEMSGGERAAFESELENDAALAAAVEEARGVAGQLQQLYANETTPPLDPDRRQTIVNGGADAQLPGGSELPGAVVELPVHRPNAWYVPALVLAAAAVLLLLVGVAPWWRQPGTPVAMDEQAQSSAPVSENGGPESVRQPESARESATVGLLSETVSESRSAKRGAAASGRKGLNVDAKQNVDEKQEVNVPQQGQSSTSGTESFDAASVATVERSAQQVAAGKNPASGARISGFRSPGQLDQGDAPIAAGAQPMADEVFEQLKLPNEIRRQAETISPPRSKLAADPKPAANPTPNRANLRRKTASVDKAQDHQVVPSAESAEVGNRDFPSAAPEGFRGGRRLRQLEEMNKDAVPTELGAVVTPTPKPASRELERLQDLEAAAPRAGGLGGGGLGGGGLGGGVGGFAGGRASNASPMLSQRPIADAGDADGLADDVADPNGRGPGIPGDQFTPITDNPFKRVTEAPVSTFSVDVDTASYSKTRDFLLRAGQLPSPDAVRIEELINYFEYDDKAPRADAEHPFATHVEITSCPWNTAHQLARIGLQGKTMTNGQRPPCNLVFLLDVSGSMNAANKLPLVVAGMQMLIDQLKPEDRVAIIVYAGSEGIVLDSTAAEKKSEIKAALSRLSAGGSTNGGAGISLAYQTARDNFISDGVNRVILCTDGDFNVGVTDTSELVRLVEKEAKGGIFLSVLGFGMGNHNDAMLEQISGRGNGNYAFIDTPHEARKVLVDQTNGTLVTIAKDVKIQIEFNPQQVAQYRLIGYENRMLATADFNDDNKDAGEIGAGHAVTALYELVPAGQQAAAAQPKVDPLKYQTEPVPTKAADGDELMTLKLRYKQPDGDQSTLVESMVTNNSVEFDKASDDVRFAAAVAGFGMKLRRSPYAGTWTFAQIQQVASGATGEDDDELRAEFVDLVRKASELMGEK